MDIVFTESSPGSTHLFPLAGFTVGDGIKIKGIHPASSFGRLLMTGIWQKQNIFLNLILKRIEIFIKNGIF